MTDTIILDRWTWTVMPTSMVIGKRAWLAVLKIVCNKDWLGILTCWHLTLSLSPVLACMVDAQRSIAWELWSVLPRFWHDHFPIILLSSHTKPCHCSPKKYSDTEGFLTNISVYYIGATPGLSDEMINYYIIPPFGPSRFHWESRSSGGWWLIIGY